MSDVTKEDYIKALENRKKANDIISKFVEQKSKIIKKGGCPECGIRRSVSNSKKTWCPDCGHVYCENKNGLYAFG